MNTVTFAVIGAAANLADQFSICAQGTPTAVHRHVHKGVRITSVSMHYQL
jgi:hypothetical protein